MTGKNKSVKIQRHSGSEIYAALWAELRKTWRSKTLWMTVLAFLLISFICGLFMYILKDPEQARHLGLLGAKAEIFGGSADWTHFFNLILVIISAGGLVIFGFIFVWIFGREFGNKTVYDMLALPTSRVIIVTAKIITASYWSVALILLTFVLMLGIGAVLQLPGWSATLIITGLQQMLVTGLLAVVLCIPFALVASFTRGYLPAIGCIFAVLALGQVFDTLGYGQYFPWAVPLLYSGAAEALTGTPTTPLSLKSYILVAITSILSLIGIGVWWRNADQT